MKVKSPGQSSSGYIAGVRFVVHFRENIGLVISCSNAKQLECFNAMIETLRRIPFIADLKVRTLLLKPFLLLIYENNNSR